MESNINNKYKICINGLSAKTGGGVRYLYNLLKSVPNNYNITVLLNENMKDIFSDIDGDVRVVTFNIKNIIIRILIEQIWIPFFFIKNKFNLLYSPADMATILIRTKQVMGVQNPNPYYSLDVHYNFNIRIKNYFQKIIAFISSKVVVGIIFVSKSIRKEFQKHIDYKGKTRVVYHGLNPLSPKIKSSKLSKPYDYILCVSDFYSHKNFEVLIRAYNLLSNHIKSNNKLLIVGGFENKVYHRKIDNMIKKYDLTKRVILTGKVDYDEVFKYYHDAKIFIMPSILETFGIPIIEAAQYGLPLLLAKSSCLPEIGGDYAEYFQSHDHLKLKNQITELLSNKAIYDKHSKKSHQLSKKFSWVSTRKETYQFFRSCLN